MKIEFYPGDTIEKALKALAALREQGIFAQGQFNEVTLTSHMTEDEAYLAVTHKTKAEFDREQEEWHREYERRERAHKKNIPKLTKVWIARGKEILSKDRWELWKQMVPIRLSDLYKGIELEMCLEIVEILNSGQPIETAKKKIEDQGHSGMSFSLVCSMVRELCDRGQEFVEYVR